MGELTAEAVADRIVPRTPRPSPDGRWVVSVTATAGTPSVSGLSLVRADGGEPARPLTPAAEAADREPHWSPDSRWVCFLSDRAVRGTAQLYRVAREGGTPERLTDRRGGISGYALVPESGRVVLIAPEEAERPADPRVRVAEPGRARVPHPTWDTVERPDRLWLLDPRTGAADRLGDFGRRHVAEAAVRPDGTVAAVLTWSVADREPGFFEPGLHLVDLATGALLDLGAPALEASALTWWRDDSGWRLGYLGLTPPGLVGGQAVFEVEGPGAHRNRTAGLPRCPIDLAGTGGGPPLALFAEGLDTTVRRLEPATKTFAELIRVRGGVRSLAAGGGKIAVVARTAAEPDAVHAGPADGPLTALGEPQLRGIRRGEQERLSYRAEDGLDLDGLLILPHGRTRADGPFPLVTMVHGGPYDRYADGFDLHWARSGQWLAAAGFAVFLPNPRGGLGRGHAFAASVAGAVGGAEFTDLLAGIDHLVEAGVADGSRLGIGGWSHGGFMAAWAVSQTDRFTAALVGAGVIDWTLLAATGEHTRYEAALGGRDNSPITYADRIATPVLILHGEDDTNVPLAQGELLHRALHDRAHEYVVYPREGHSFRERGHQLDVLRRTREWFSRWLTPDLQARTPPAGRPV